MSKRNALAGAKSGSGLLDATEELRMMLEPILEPILFRPEPDQDAGRAAVPCDHDFFVDGEPEVFGQVILDLRQSHLLWSFPLACRLARATTALQLS